MQISFDKLDQLERPSLTLCNPNRTELFSLDLALDFKYIPRMNAVSEINFTFPKSVDNGNTILPAYDYIKNKRLVKMEGVGYFVITQPEEETGGEIPKKTVKAESQEIELNSKKFTSFSGTYQFYNSTDPSNTILGKVFELAPTWSVGTIDTELEIMFRTFDVSDTTLLGFLMNDVAKGFGCVFSFDTINKRISASLTENATIPSDIYMSYDNLITKGSFSEIQEEITTCLYCYGGGSLDIHSVNPLGTAAIYNFNYFKTTEWMDQSLIDAINAWEAKIDQYQPIYAGYLTSVMNLNTELVTKQSELAELQSQYDALEGVMKVRIEQKLDYKDIKYELDTKQTEIDSKKADISRTQESVNYYEDLIKKINADLKFVNKYTIAQQTSTQSQRDYLANTDIPNKQQRIVYINSQIDAIRVMLKSALSQNPPDLAQADFLNREINIHLNEIDQLNAIIIVDQKQIAEYDILLADMYYDLLSLGNFTSDQYSTLTSFIYENTYQNENIIKTDSMTNNEIQVQAQYLYDQAKQIIAKTSQPRYEFSVDAVNFLWLKEYQSFSSAIEPGTVVTVDLENGTTIETIVLEMEINYEKPDDISITFSNRLRLDNAVYRFFDLQEQFQKASTTTSFKSTDWDNWTNEYKNDVSSFINSALNTANNKIINSNNQEITINQNGLRARTVIDPNAETKTYQDTQLWVTSGLLAFTDDNWNSTKLALGKITTPGGSEKFGLVADVIVGRLVAGNELVISSSDTSKPDDQKQFLFNSQGAFFNNAKVTIKNANNEIYLDPTAQSVFRIRTNVGGSWSDKLWVDTAGNLNVAGNGTFTGTIIGTAGSIGGIGLGSIPGSAYSGIYITSNPGSYYIRSNGDMKWGNLTISGGNFIFNGTINANQIVGQLVNDQIASGLYADKLNGGGMGFSRSGNGKITWPNAEMSVSATGAPYIKGDTSMTIYGGTSGYYLGLSNNGLTIYTPLPGTTPAINIYGFIDTHDYAIKCGNVSGKNFYANSLNMSGNISMGSNSISLSSPYNFSCSNTHSQPVYVANWYGGERIQMNFVNGLLMSVS